MTGRNPRADPYGNRRQVLYWRLLARLVDHEEQATLESASLAVVEDIGLPAALLDPQASVDSIVQRHPELAAEFDGLMVPGPGAGGARDRAAEIRRAALVSKLLLNVFASGPGAVTAGHLARWQSDAGWLERALGCRPGELRGGRADGGAGKGAAGPGVSPAGTGGGTAPDLQPADSGDRPGARGYRSRPRQADAPARGARRSQTRRTTDPEHVADRAVAAGQEQLLGRGPGQRQGPHPAFRRRGRRGTAHPGGTGARFIPVGSVTSSGRGNVNPWFRERFKDLGTPVISGHIRKLVHELKTFLA